MASKNIALGIFDGLEYLFKDSVHRNRNAFSYSAKLLNEIRGVKLLDALDRRDIKNLIIRNLPNIDGIKLKV